MPPLTDAFPLPVLSEGCACQAPWRSLAEKRGESPAHVDEFPPGASLPPEGLSRRALLELAATGVMGAGLSGCFRQPAEKVLPYSQRPEGLTPGLPLHYATGLTLEGLTVGLVVACREGRPIKVEGNALHPESRGAAGVLEQASLQSLYEPRRLQEVRHGSKRASRAELLEALAASAARTDGGAGLRFLVEPSRSLLVTRLLQQIQQRLPQARFVPFSSGHGQGAAAALKLAFGRPLEALPRLEKARVVVSLAADFLTSLPGDIPLARDFVQARQPPHLNRLWVAESALTLTGAFADQRLRLRPSRLEALARLLVGEVARRLGRADLQTLAGAGVGMGEEERRWAAGAAADLVAHRGEGLVLAGGEQSQALHLLALRLNEALGNLGTTLHFTDAQLQPEGGPTLAELAREVAEGRVDTLVVTAWNPVYAAPADVDVAGMLARAPHVFYASLEDDETVPHCRWVAPALHPFEAWGDGRARDGTASILQPLVAPLFPELVHPLELLLPFAGLQAKSPYEVLQQVWREEVGSPPDFPARWEAWLAEGVIPGTVLPTGVPPLQAEAVRAALQAPVPPASAGLELQLTRDVKGVDGRFAHNAWLQELPHPLTQLSWDSAALVSPATARRLGLESGAVVRLTREGHTLETPVLVMPGQADDTLTLPLGYGRTRGGVGEGVGARASALRTQTAPWGGGGLQLEPTGRTHTLVLAQEHWRMEGRPLALETTAKALAEDPHAFSFLREEPEQLYGPRPRQGEYRWGMAVDLHRCIGCSACVVACQAENNIPAVGREEVRRGREMHWLRIDRYFLGSEEDPGAITQPVLCVHCELAPCEYVCPVAATVHNDEGLNQMVYNRCVGTRYCSNNCPYKVRRFNYLTYTKRKPLEQLVFNPEVTVRPRGVMEKCTWCVQRIERARITSRLEGRRIREGEVQTACQQACPTNTIVFGQLDAEGSEVARLHDDPRAYALLHHLGTRPRTRHLVRLKNPAEGMA